MARLMGRWWRNLMLTDGSYTTLVAWAIGIGAVAWFWHEIECWLLAREGRKMKAEAAERERRRRISDAWLLNLDTRWED